jgi:hypothetical protein
LTSQTIRVPAVAVVGANQHLPSRAPGAGATTIGATGTVLGIVGSSGLAFA